ncbi:MAG: RNA polymerase sigma-54 factor, partial [Bacteroidota bacterium]
MRRDPEAIIDDLMFVQNVQATRQEVDKWLCEIQRFDPPGIGAKDLQECLVIQIDLKLESEDLDLEQIESLEIARQVLDQHFEEFSKKHYQRLIRRLSIEEEDLRGAIQEILKLNPKPASGYASGLNRGTQYVVPDFIIVNRDGELELTLNARNAPDLRINDQYKDMLQSYSASKKAGTGNRQNRDAVMFIKQKIDSARWFIDAIRQRQDTMYRTMYAIMQLQYDFFLTGDDMKLRPMILK